MTGGITRLPVAPAPIDTPRLRLDPLRVEDAEEMAEVLADPALYVFTGGEPPSPDALRAQFAAQVLGRGADRDETWRTWVVRQRGDGAAVGYVQATIVPDGPTADVAWVVGTPWQGRGYATEAAAAMVARLAAADGVRGVTAHVRGDHLASASVARRLGLRASGEVEDGEEVWVMDLGARATASRWRTVRLNLGVGVGLVGFAAFELVLARSGQLPRSGDQLARDLLLAAAGVAMLAYAAATWWRHRA